MITFVAIVIVACIAFIIYAYNSIVGARQHAIEAWSDIDVQLKRRHDLIPNLVTVVNKYASYEKELFTKISELRTKALSVTAEDMKGKSQIEKDIESNLKSLIAIAESYPDLKADQQFLKLQEELTETEDQIASARRIYNSNVADYNAAIASFPANIIATINHLTAFSYFQSE